MCLKLKNRVKRIIFFFVWLFSNFDVIGLLLILGLVNRITFARKFRPPHWSGNEELNVSYSGWKLQILSIKHFNSATSKWPSLGKGKLVKPLRLICRFGSYSYITKYHSNTLGMALSSLVYWFPIRLISIHFFCQNSQHHLLSCMHCSNEAKIFQNIHKKIGL